MPKKTYSINIAIKTSYLIDANSKKEAIRIVKNNFLVENNIQLDNSEIEKIEIVNNKKTKI